MNEERIVACECCGGVLTPSYHVRGYHYQRCVTCKYIILPGRYNASHTTRLYDDAYFTGGGVGYADYTSEAKLLSDRGRYYGELLRKYVEPTTLLDVGAAAGYTMQGFSQAGWRVSGIEPNQSMADIARAAGQHVVTCSLEQLEDTGTFGVIAMLQIVAHLYDVQQAFERAAAATRRQGLWLIETWNSESLSARAFGENWHELSPPSVLRIFTKEALTRLALQYGLRLVDSGRPRKRILGSHAKSLIAEKAQWSQLWRLASKGLRWLPDDSELPYPFDDLHWYVFRMS